MATTGDPLYIGVTTNIVRRLNEHRVRSWWAADLGVITWEGVSRLDVAFGMERWLIGAYKPYANHQHIVGDDVFPRLPFGTPQADWNSLRRLQASIRYYEDELASRGAS